MSVELIILFSWWIEAAAAYRDGIIQGSMYGITADDSKAYAIVMTDGQEIDTAEEHMIKYIPPATDPGRFKLMKNLTSQHPVRILRTWQLHSKWKPKAGLRYDGLLVLCADYAFLHRKLSLELSLMNQS